MASSNFQKVVDFNTSFGVLTDTNLQPKLNIFDENPKEPEFCLKLIREEVKELEQAVKEKDMIETADALADILYVVYGMGARLGLNMDTIFNLVHDNNMSKLCSSEKEAIETVEYYKNTSTVYDSPCYRKAPIGSFWVVYNASTNKVLKSIAWKPVNLKPAIHK